MSNTSTITLPPYLARLDDYQQAAALDTEGYVIIHACAGAGKSAVLAARAAYLLNAGVAPENLLCVTFTNKAADEMRSRIESYSGRNLSSMWIGTYHSICARILRSYGSAIGIPSDFDILDEQESFHIVRQIANNSGFNGKNIKLRDLKNEIDRFKSQLIDFDGWCKSPQRIGNGMDSNTFYRFYQAYQDRLRSANLLDFNDLTREVLKLLLSSPIVRRDVSSRFQYLLVDEYQDSSQVEAEILRLLSSHHNNLCVVGDVRQSIFKWRGSDCHLMMNFEKQYASVKSHILNTNYRSARSIVSAAERIMAVGITKPGYACIPNRADLGQVHILRFESDMEEAKVISTAISESVKSGIIAHSDIAVLARTRTTTRTLEDMFRKHSIPFISTGRPDWLVSLEVQRTLLYLRKVLDQDGNSADSDVPAYRDRSGRKTIEKLQRMHKCGVTLQTLLEQTIQYVKDELVLRDDKKANTNLYELYQTGFKHPGTSIYALPSFLASLESEGSDDKVNANAVSIMTIHMSKGLQFRLVFLVGMEERIMPSWQSIGDSAALGEERRLCYVAMTRAKDWLCLCSSRTRRLNSRLQSLEVSRFIHEIHSSKP